MLPRLPTGVLAPVAACPVGLPRTFPTFSFSSDNGTSTSIAPFRPCPNLPVAAVVVLALYWVLPLTTVTVPSVYVTLPELLTVTSTAFGPVSPDGFFQ